MGVLLQVMTLFLLMMAGLGAVRFRVLGDRDISSLNAFVLYFAQPCLILARLQQDTNPSLLRELGWVFALTCAVMLLSALLAHRLFHGQSHDRRAVLTNLAMASNCGFMGYPVITAAFGPDALIYAVMYVTAFNLMCWTLGAYYFGGSKAVDPLRLIRNPSILAIAAGVVLLLTGWRLPGFLNDALELMGSTTTPVAMFIIGSRLLGLRREHLLDLPLLGVCGLRLIAVPAAVLLLRLTPLPPMVVNAVYLCAAMPCAALTGMQSDLYDCDRALASRGVALSSALSMVTVPLMLLFV